MSGEQLGIGIGIVLLLIVLMWYLILIAFAVVCYIFGSKGLYAIAARRGIKNPWMAWIPIVSNWTLGCVSDQYAKRKYGQDPNLRKKLLIFSIITQSGMTVTPAIGSFSVNFNFGNLGGSGNGLFGQELPEFARIALIVFGVFAITFGIAALVLSIIQTVYQYKAYYNLYASSKPQQAVLFLVLSIVTPAGPFLTYACRNSDDGLPPEETPAPDPAQ